MSEARVVDESEVESEHWADDVRGEVTFRAAFGDSSTPEFTAGVTELEPGGWLGHHRHEPAEVYYVVQGEGTLTIDGREYRVGRGATVYVPGSSEHGIRNTGEELLRFFYVFAVGSFDPSEYHFTAAQ